MEYLLVLGAFVTMLTAMAAVWHFAGDGGLLGLATSSASHGMGQGLIGLLKDVVGF